MLIQRNTQKNFKVAPIFLTMLIWYFMLEWLVFLVQSSICTLLHDFFLLIKRFLVKRYFHWYIFCLYRVKETYFGHRRFQRLQFNSHLLGLGNSYRFDWTSGGCIWIQNTNGFRFGSTRDHIGLTHFALSNYHFSQDLKYFRHSIHIIYWIRNFIIHQKINLHLRLAAR